MIKLDQYKLIKMRACVSNVIYCTECPLDTAQWTLPSEIKNSFCISNTNNKIQGQANPNFAVALGAYLLFYKYKFNPKPLRTKALN